MLLVISNEKYKSNFTYSKYFVWLVISNEKYKSNSNLYDMVIVNRSPVDGGVTCEFV